MRSDLSGTSTLYPSFVKGQRGAVSVLFASMAIPLVIATALSVDFSFYEDSKSQLDVAADAAALHAVRVASSEFIAGIPTDQALADGKAAGQQWFDAQLGTLEGSKDISGSAGVTVNDVTFNATNGQFSDTVTYSGNISTRMGTQIAGLMKQWPIGGSSTATIAANSYSEFQILVDNSSSMLIGAEQADIIALEQGSLCPPTAIATAVGRKLNEYSWNYPSNVGYGKGQTVPTASAVQGSCYSTFTGDSSQCPYPQGMTGTETEAEEGAYNGVDQYGYCQAPGTGIPSAIKTIDPATQQIANVPLGPCGFACHENSTGDYYTLARNNNKIHLRFDVIQAAMATVVGYLAGAQKIDNQFTIGVFQFNSAVAQVHPSPNGAFSEADNDLATATSDIKAITTPIVPDVPNTDFPGAMTYLSGKLTAAGNGSSATSRTKNMFIITDGMQDYQPSGGRRTIGPMTTISPEPNCSKLKALGFNIYVLYTPYYPLPNPFYLGSGPRGYAEPTVPPATINPNIAALQACATTTAQFYQASDTASINNALKLMVQSALASPGGFSD